MLADGQMLATPAGLWGALPQCHVLASMDPCLIRELSPSLSGSCRHFLNLSKKLL